MSGLRVSGLTVSAPGARRLVDDVSFSLGAGEILGLVGESGSGKTLTGRALMRLMPDPSLRVTAGAAHLGGRDVLALSEAAFRAVRGREIGMIFQNPGSHLDPVRSIGAQIAETIMLHEGAGRRAAQAAAVDLLRQVGVPDPARRARGYAHEFSGGMRQRAMIALALACNPAVLIADEPTTALDVTVQAQILRLLLDLRDRRGLSILFITHDLGVVAQVCDGICVLYGGRICERGPKHAVLSQPAHPYTQGLIACHPGAAAGRLIAIPGQPPGPGEETAGCRFRPRCPRATAACTARQPPLEVRGPDHAAACWALTPDAARAEAVA